MWSICKKEWTQYFNGITGYLVIGLYLLLNGFFLFVYPSYNILHFGYVSLQVYFDFAPWFLMVLIPSVTMRTIAEERQSGTLELLQSLPVSSIQIVLGKFLGAFLIVLTAIAPTITYAFLLNHLSTAGGLDWGALMGSYIGLISLAGIFVAIGIYASSRSKQNIVGLVLGMIIIFLLYQGFDGIANWGIFSNNTNYWLRYLGLQWHYQNISKGLVGSQDLFYFVSIIYLFLVGTREKMDNKKSKLLVFLPIVLVNIISIWFSFQWDATQDKRFTLSDASVEVIRKVEAPIQIRLYLQGDLPAHYQSLSNSTIDLLDKIQSLNPKQIDWKIETIHLDGKDSSQFYVYDSLVKLGLPIERLQTSVDKTSKRSEQLIMPGILVSQAGKEPIAIDLRSAKKYFKPYNIVQDVPVEDVDANFNAAASAVEFKLVHALYLMSRKTIPTIGYVVGNGEPVDYSVNDIGQLIRHQYDVKIVPLQNVFPDPRAINTLLIVKPKTSFSTLDKLKLDQYVMKGGNIIWAIDKLYAESDSLKNTNGSYVAFNRGLQLDDLLFKYGVRINDDLVQDLQCAKLPVVVSVTEDGKPNIQRMPWPYYPFAMGNASHVITKNVDRILTQFPSSIDTVSAKGIQKTILLTTDTNTRIIKTPALIALGSGMEASEWTSFTQRKVPIAVLLEGKFTSLFQNNISAAFRDSIVQHTNQDFIPTSNKSSKQIVISDASVFTNEVDKTNGPVPMGVLPYEEYPFANAQFYTNAIGYLTEPASLMESRNKLYTLRLLDKSKIEAQSSFWQFILIGLPLFILILAYFIWNSIRKNVYSSYES